VLQLASFHRRYEFAVAEVDNSDNASIRPQFPMLYLLLE
jgi:hypothetical protein